MSPPNVVNEVAENCSDADDSEKLCLSWGNTLRLNVVKADDSCVTINWTLLVSFIFPSFKRVFPPIKLIIACRKIS